MSKPNKQKKLNAKIKRLNGDLYDNNKHITREEFVISKLSKRVKQYYIKLSEERKLAFIRYIIKQDDWQITINLEELSVKNTVPVLCSKKCKSIAELIDNIKKEKKSIKKKERKYILKSKSGLITLLNPEAYDHTLLSKKNYRKYLKKLAKDEQEAPSVELDCTLKNFKKELMKNNNVNGAVMDSFYNKFGY